MQPHVPWYVWLCSYWWLPLLALLGAASIKRTRGHIDIDIDIDSFGGNLNILYTVPVGMQTVYGRLHVRVIAHVHLSHHA